MMSLNSHQKQLIFDYCIGLTSAEETAEAAHLISSNKEASELYIKLKTPLAPLDSLKPESCPDDLAEQTVWRLNNLARSSRTRLHELLAAEQSRAKTIKTSLWFSIGRRLAMAAVFVIVGGAAITTLNLITKVARQKSWQQMCQMQLSNIWRGMNDYSADNDGKLPAVATAEGSPWWKVGCPGQENHSNTRHMWLLVKGNYVKPVDFVCQATRDTQISQFDPSKSKDLCDFPSRKFVTYSFRLMPPKAESVSNLSTQRVLMSDLNPLFEKLPQDYSKSLTLTPDEVQLNANSANHNRRGQNVLFGDGRVEFVGSRRLGPARDDIFTLQNTNVYRGCEVPANESDAFLAP